MIPASRRNVGVGVAVVVLLLFVGVAVPGAVADSESDFSVVSIETGEAVEAGGDLTVTATIVNQGDVNDTQDVRLTDQQDTVKDRTTVSLEPGESTTVQLTWPGVPDRERDIEPKVKTDDASESTVVTVLWSNFQVSEIKPETTKLVQGGTFDASATVRNTGTEADSQDISLSIDGTEYDVESGVEIGPEGSTTVAFTGVTPDLGPGTYEYTIESANDSASGTLEVTAAANIVIDSITGVYQDETAVVDAVVRNDDEIAGEQSVTLTVDDRKIEAKTVALDPGETSQVRFTYEPESLPLTATVSTERDTASLSMGNVTVESIDGQVEDGTATVEAVIANQDAVGAEQTIEFEVDGEVAKTETVFLEGGERQTLTFTHDPESLPINVTAFTDIDAESVRIGGVNIENGPTVEGATPDVMAVDGSVTLTYTAAGENLDAAELRVHGPDGSLVFSDTVAGGVNAQYTLVQSDLATFAEGAYDVTLWARDDFGGTDTETLEGAFEATARFDTGPSIETVTPDQPVVGEQITVDYGVAGTNLDSATLRVENSAGTVVLERAVPIGVGGQAAFELGDLDPLFEGDYDVTLAVTDVFGNVFSDTQEDAFVGMSTVETGPRVDSVSPEVVQVDNTLTIGYSASGTNMESASIQITGPEGETVLDRTVQQGTGQQVEINPRDIDGIGEGPHDVTVTLTDVFGNTETTTRESAFEMAPVYNPDDANFGTTPSSTDGIVATYTGVAGDFVTVSVSLNELDEAYIVIGGDRAEDGEQSGAPLDILHVDGSATFMINTRLVGTDRPSEQVYIPLEGSVTSYEHTFGADTPVTEAGVFSDLAFETEGYEQAATSLTEFRAATSSGQQARPLQPGSEISMVIAGGDSLVVTEEGFPDARYPLDRATIKLTQPKITNVTTYRLPTGNADERSFALDPSDIEELEPGDISGLLGAATQTDTIAENDRLLIEVEASGMWGALLDSIGGSERVSGENPALIDARNFRTLLDRREGIRFEMVHTNDGPNVGKTEANLFSAPPDEVSIITEPPLGTSAVETSRFYILVDTREAEPFDPELAGGERFDIRMSYVPPEEEPYRFKTVAPSVLPAPFDPIQYTLQPEVYPYLEPGGPVQQETATIDVLDRTVEYNNTDGEGNPIVPNTGGARLSGTTTLAPGSNLPVNIVIDVRDESTKVEISDISIAEDGSFDVQTDLSMLDPGAEVDIEFWAYQKLLDERQLTVVDDDDLTGNFTVTEFSAESVVTLEDTFVETSAVITNNGLSSDTQTVELVLDGDVVANETLDLDPEERRVLNFDNALTGLDSGQYPLEVRTDDDFAGTVLVVEEADSVFQVRNVTASATIEDEQPVVDFETRIRNIGALNGTESIELLVDGVVAGERNTSLLSGAETTYTFENELSDLDVGNHTLTVRTQYNEQSVNVTLDEPSANFTIANVSVAQTVQANETIEPTIQVTNTGTMRDSGTVTTRLDGDVIDESLVNLGPAENGTVSVQETALDGEGTYTLRVETPDDEQTVEIRVEATDDQTDSESSDGDGEDETDDGTDGDDDSSDGDDDDESGGIAIGAGRRAVIGGTAVVGLVHVLGYWV